MSSSSSFGDVVELKTPQGLSVSIVEKGLHVSSIAFDDKHGKKHDIIIGGDEGTDYVQSRKFLHCLVGRYCNRLPATSLTLPPSPSNPSAKPVEISPEQFGEPGASLHGGPPAAGWDQKVLKRVTTPELFSEKEIEVLKKAEAAGEAAVWSLISEDGEGGHAGKVYCEVAFAVLPPAEGSTDEVGQVIVIYRAKLLEGEATALNLTHHWGFNLEASEAGRDGSKTATPTDVKSHLWEVKSKKMLELQPVSFLPTGKLISLPEGNPAKTFLPAKTLGDGYPKDGYDDYWVIDRAPKDDIAVKGDKFTADVFDDMEKDTDIVSTLSSEKTGLALAFTTNQPGLQAWSGTGGYDGSEARKSIHGGSNTKGTGDGYRVPPALAMEFHAIYGGWMHPELKSLGWDTVLYKGEIYNNWVKMSIISK